MGGWRADEGGRRGEGGIGGLKGRVGGLEGKLSGLGSVEIHLHGVQGVRLDVSLFFERKETNCVAAVVHVLTFFKRGMKQKRVSMCEKYSVQKGIIDHQTSLS